MKRTLSLFLASLMLASALISCSAPADDPADTTASAETTLPAETEPKETGRADAKDNLPADLKLNGMKVHMHSFSGETWDIIGKNEESGDMIFDAVYYRTLSVADRLDVKFEWTDSPHEKWQDFSASLESTILAGDDVWQIVFAQGNSTIQSNRDHLFMDMADSKYLDLEQPWWWSDAMYEVSFDGQMRRYLIGDICLTNFLRAGAVYFNKNMYEDALGNPDDLYKLVIDGGWTLDKMGELAAAAYRDINGNGQLDDGDVYGFHFGKKDYIVHMEYALDVERFHRDDRGYPVLEYDLERAQLAVEKMNKLLYQTKGCAFNNTAHITAADFAARKTFFFGNQLLAAVNAAMRDMEDDYGIIPFPKLDEKQEDYKNLLFNSSTVVTVPITCKQHENVGAVIEAMCAESYRSVVEAFYETALKMKYSRDSFSGQCIDIIRNVTRKNLMYEYNAQLGYSAMLITNCVAVNSNDIASSIASVTPAANEKIQQKIASLEKDKAANAK